MYPVIYRKFDNGDVFDFDNNYQSYPSGYEGVLSDVVSCKITAEVNGEYVLTMKYPASGVYASCIKPFAIITVDAPIYRGVKYPSFYINKIEKDINGYINVEAFNLVYLLKYLPVYDLTPPAGNYFNNVLTRMSNFGTYFKNGKISSSPINLLYAADPEYSSKTYSMEKVVSANEFFCGMEGSFIDTVGGNLTPKLAGYSWDKNDHESDVIIRYSENIKDFKWSVDYSDVYTACIPFWSRRENDTVTLVTPANNNDGKIVKTSHANDYQFLMTRPLDLSSEFDSAPTDAKLRSKALSYMNKNKVWEPRVTVDVKFIPLSATHEYKHLGIVYELCVGDIVTVEVPNMGVNVKAKVNRMEYDVLKERPVNISVGNKKVTFADTLVGYKRRG